MVTPIRGGRSDAGEKEEALCVKYPYCCFLNPLNVCNWKLGVRLIYRSEMFIFTPIALLINSADLCLEEE